jgi:hypothetical protein
MKKNRQWNLFTLVTVIFTILMPFYVFLKVLFEHKFWISGFGIFIKEWLLIFLWFIVIYEFIKNKVFPKIELLDIFILLYFMYWIGITIYQWLPIEHIIYGWRYDFVFLWVFLLYKHAAQFLKIRSNKLIQYFLISASVSIFLWIMIKFMLWESTLMYFGFSDYASNWTYNGSIPTHHGLDWSGIKRFQWLLEWPNAMWYFLIVYTALFLHVQKHKVQFHNVLFFILMLWFVLLTYSRSALLGIWVAWVSLFFLHIKFIYHKVRKYILPILLVFFIIFGSIAYIFQEKIYYAVIRPGSTAWHFERMEIWINRFQDNIYGAWLATSGPAFRNVYPNKTSRLDEEYYIPESWFIQQLTEWGFIYFSLFILIFLTLLLKTYKKSPMIFWALVAVLVMNVFLHIFESTHLSYVFFMILWVIIYENRKSQRI